MELLSALIILVIVCGVFMIARMISAVISAFKDVLEYLKERKELKWM